MDSTGSYCELSNPDQQHISIRQIDSSELYVDWAYLEHDQINGQMVLTFTTTFLPWAFSMYEG